MELKLMNLNLNSIEKVLIENKNIIFKNLFGSWIDQIPWYLSRIVAKEQIYEAFLKLLEIWAQENKIVFFPPEQFYNKNLKTYLTPIKIKEKFKYSKIHWRQIIILMEIVVLLVSSFVPKGELNVYVNIAISFVCSLQVQAFRKIRGNISATTMCTGNLRSGTENLYHYLL